MAKIYKPKNLGLKEIHFTRVLDHLEKEVKGRFLLKMNTPILRQEVQQYVIDQLLLYTREMNYFISNPNFKLSVKEDPKDSTRLLVSPDDLYTAIFLFTGKIVPRLFLGDRKEYAIGGFRIFFDETVEEFLLTSCF